LNSNAILASLSPTDVAYLRPHLKRVHVAARQVLYRPGQPIAVAYFPVDCVVSLMIGLATGQFVETAMLGNDSVVGGDAVLGSEAPACLAMVQLAGNTLICDITVLRHAAARSPALAATIARHEQALLFQTQQSAACKAAHRVEAQLLRTLLRARDLAQGDRLGFTHEVLAEMLGVRRTSVTEAAQALQKAGLIRYARGKIEMVDVDRLREAACACNEAVKSRYRSLLRSPVAIYRAAAPAEGVDEAGAPPSYLGQVAGNERPAKASP
jgi:CRP-like cAMP-binding protein